MKILYLHQYFKTPTKPGGTRSYEMARRLVAAGHEVHMIASWRGDDEVSGWVNTVEEGINVHWYPVPYSNHMSYSQRIKSFFAFALAARSKARSLVCDVVFATSTPLTIAIPAVLAAKKHKVPMVFEVRDLWPELPIAMGALRNPMGIFLAKKLERWAYRHSSAVVALSPGMKEGVVRAGYPEDRVVVIPNSSDNDEFCHNEIAAQEFRAARPWLGNRPLLVYAGTFGRINGLGYLIDLAKALQGRKSDIRILLVGDGQERDKLEKRAKELGVLNENLFIEGKLAKNDMPALLSAATVASSLFIDLPEMQVNSANKYFDALASSTPVLINYGGWHHDLIEGCGCGLAMWQKPVDAVAEVLCEKMYDQKWLDSAGASARRLAEERFGRDMLARDLEKVISTVVAGEGEGVVSVIAGVDSRSASRADRLKRSDMEFTS